ncbi:MAG TPA: polyketide synthase dehydratase domain-containing protein [Syntrophales bacterium]|nr:polyketide synthase dehydratase domain-containing protein [Syntrophales bacterium]
MEDTSRLIERIRLPLIIPVHPYLRDHHFESKIIFPAVEELQHLAASVRAYRPDAHVGCMSSATFDRFLNIEKDAEIIEACNELEVYESGRIFSKLITIDRIRGTMTRTKVHTAVSFTAAGERFAGMPMDTASAVEGFPYKMSPEKLYSDLVPFGPSYQNVRGDILLAKSGAVAKVYAAVNQAPSEPLGSPFPLDGALHVACAWGQRYYNIVAFPVGFEERIIVKSTIPGETYRCRILPAAVPGESLLFDIWIYDLSGDLCEEIRGVIMRDVSGGRVKPPGWVLYSPLVRPFDKQG